MKREGFSVLWRWRGKIHAFNVAWPYSFGRRIFRVWHTSMVA